MVMNVEIDDLDQDDHTDRLKKLGPEFDAGVKIEPCQIRQKISGIEQKRVGTDTESPQDKPGP